MAASSNGMRHVQLGVVFSERKERGQPGLPVMSVTMNGGVVERGSLDRRVVSDLTPEQHLLARKGDIVYNMMRMWQGVSGLVPEDCLISPAYVVLEPQPGLDPTFAAYLLKSDATIRKLHRFSQGLTGDRLRLYYDQLKSIPVEIPPEHIQKSIADALQSVDDLIASSNVVIHQWQQLKASLLQDQLSTGGPGRHSSFVEVPGIGRLPGSWQSVRLGELCQSAIDGPFGSNLKSEHYQPYGVRVIRLQNIGLGDFNNDDQAFISDDHFTGLRKYETQEGDLLVASLGDDKWPAGRCCRVPQSILPAIIKADCFRLRIDADKANPDFVKWYLNSSLARRAIDRGSHGQTRTRLNLANAKKIKIPLPPMNEQEKISELIQTVHERALGEEARLAQLRTLKAALSQDLLAGRIPVKGDR